MTMFGKILVFLNLALSLMFAAWALGAFTQRVDWTENRKSKDPTDERPPGKVARLKDEIDRLNTNKRKDNTELPSPRNAAESRWQTSLTALRAAEKFRQDYKVWYDEKINVLDVGTDRKGQPVAAPVSRLAYQAGRLVFEQGLPRLDAVNDKAGKPLQARTALQAEQAQLHERITQELAAIEKLEKEAADLTDKLRVAFTELERAALVERNSEEEQKYLEQILYNVQVESQVLVERQKELEARLRELQALRATSQRQKGP